MNILLSSVDSIHVEYTDSLFLYKIVTKLWEPCNLWLMIDWQVKLNSSWNNSLKCTTGNAYLLKMTWLIWSIFCKLIEKIDSWCSQGKVFHEITVGHKTMCWGNSTMESSPDFASLCAWVAGLSKCEFLMSPGCFSSASLQFLSMFALVSASLSFLLPCYSRNPAPG